MDKLQSIKETDLSLHCVTLSGVQIDLLRLLLQSVVDETLIVDGTKFVSGFNTPPASYFRMIAWSLLLYFNNYCYPLD